MADFKKASFRPHGPVSLRPTRDTGWALACVPEHSSVDDTTFHEAFEAYKHLIDAKKAQFAALSDVVSSETALVKKSAILTAIGLGGAFVLSCICWIIVNAAIGIALDRSGVHLALTTLILLAMNGIMIAFFAKMVLDSYRYISIRPVWKAITGHAGVEAPQSEKDH